MWYGADKRASEIVVTRSNDTHSVTTMFGKFAITKSRHGLGCFARCDFDKCVPLGVYPGVVTNEKKLTQKLSQMDESSQVRVQKYLVHLRDRLYLDPTDKYSGAIHKTFEHNPVLYINEPDADQVINCVQVNNHDLKRIEIWSLTKIKSNDELLISYGKSYYRDYHTQHLQDNAQGWHYKNGTLIQNHEQYKLY